MPADSDAPHLEWSWDPSLYAGSAAHYVTGRMAYPPELLAAVTSELHLDGMGTLLDVGCGPGSLTLLLAPAFARVIGLDADPEMIDEARRQAAARQVDNVEWRCMRAEELPADLPPVDVITLAQSFHWMERPRVAAAAHRLLVPGGALVHVAATTHRGVAPAGGQDPPWDAITDLVASYLGPKRTVPADFPGNEEAIYRGAGFEGPRIVTLPGRLVRRSAADVVAAVYSLSSSTPHLFGDRLPAFDRDLRALLRDAGDEFTERTRPIDMHFWRKPGPEVESARGTPRAQVVAAFLRDGNRVLLGHRSAGRRSYPDVWDLPGGHVEPGETPGAALVRELREELGITIAEPSDPPMMDVAVGGFDMSVWLVERWTGTPVNGAPDEHDAVAWFAAGELAGLRLADSSYLAVLVDLLAESS